MNARDVDDDGEPYEDPWPATDTRIWTEEILATLPDADRHLVFTHYILGFTQQEIAGMAGCHQSTISRSLSRIRRQLYKVCIINGA